MILYQPLILKNAKNEESISSLEESSTEKLPSDEKINRASPEKLNEYKDKIQHQELIKSRIQKIKKLKLIVLLILSHTFIFLLASPANTELPPPKVPTNDIDLKLWAKNYAHSASQSNELKVDIYNEQQMLLVQNVSLLKTISVSSEEDDMEQSPIVAGVHEIRLDRQAAQKLLPLLDQKFLLYPAGLKLKSKTPPIKIKNQKMKHDPFQKQWEPLL